ncbi:pimeloyl-ACP methyl ester carboxylesterase [Isoptericola jiangsuensis]|uniref:Pimeloyl-ACP methyl ester carboxylesterase n=1 Tax=Isoptericola jiangsuensis TaxID=548579 RepID=A0A2A9EYQ6_9MICO|nr:alpha/beta hydrolase [Isoptericola jiangsuensis]PFG43442.1 pimeloyl-ACP methyl ester carboxylesterase [Isoptericola jiangsuensis]
MDVILVPGFWLNASAWDAVTPPLVAAGHTVHPLTLPGMASGDDDRSGVTLADHVAAVVEQIDALPADAEVALVGHSAGGGLVYAASDARPGRVARVVYVDSGPFADGQAVDADLPADVVDHDLPDWADLDDQSLVGLTDELRRQFRERAVPQPGATVREPHRLSDDLSRLDVPTTVVASEMPSDVLRGLMAQGHPYVAELSRHHDYEIVDLPTGHWPMFTRPTDLGDAIAAALAPRTGEG